MLANQLACRCGRTWIRWATCGRRNYSAQGESGDKVTEYSGKYGEKKIKMPTINDLPVPKQGYGIMYDKENKKFNWIILGSFAVFAGTLAYFYYEDVLDLGKKLPPKSYRERWKTLVKDDRKKKKEVVRYPLAAGASIKLPEKVPYLLIGSGTASFSAARAIRAVDAEAKVLIVGEERYKPYMRPPLSKELWFCDDRKMVKDLKFRLWNGREGEIFYEPGQYYIPPEKFEDMEHGGISVINSRRVVRLDVEGHTAHLDNGQKIMYDKCLVATGGYPKLPAVIAESSLEPKKHFTLFRDADDFLYLDDLCSRIKSIVIVGGGFLGSELACALGRRAKDSELQVIQTFPETGCMAKVLPKYLSSWATDKLRSQGVKVIPEASLKAATLDKGRVTLRMEDGQTITADHVVFAVGIKPNVDLAESAGLEVDPNNGGFLCDAELRARSDVWVAGDCCSFYDVKLGRRRVEHHDHAVVSGRLAGQNMAGKKEPYLHQSMFWSDLGPEVGYEAIGVVDSSLPTVGIFAKASEMDTPKAVVEATGEFVRSISEEKSQTERSSSEPRSTDPGGETSTDDYGKGVVFYLRGKRIVGIVLWNVFNRMALARKLIMNGGEHEDFREVAKLFNLYGSMEEGP